MPAIKYIFLGFVQGLTEFLPVSSSAHLVIFQDWLEINENQILLDIILHLGTLLALVVFLFKDIMKYFFRKQILFYIFLVTAVTALMVILGKDFFEGMFDSTKKVLVPLLITGIILLCTKKFLQGRRSFSDLEVKDAIFLGIVQGFSVIPGLSRSGLTISTLLFRNVERESAVKFSFLVSIPAIFGACVLKMEDFSNLSTPEWTNIIWGFGAAFLSGLLSLRILRSVMRQARFYLFGYYCLCLALVVWLVK